MPFAPRAEIKCIDKTHTINRQGDKMKQQTKQSFKLANTSENLTAQGGLALFSEYNLSMGLNKLSDQYLPKAGSNRGFAASVFMGSSVLMLQGGGQTLEDLRELRAEASLLGLTAQNKIPDPDTMGDWLRRMGDPEKGKQGLVSLGQVRDKLLTQLLARDKRKDYTLDVDATFTAGEKYEAQWSYLKAKGYMPMLGFLFEPEICLHDEFREGNEAPASGQLEFYRECKKHLPSGKMIARYRADSASYQSQVVNELESDLVNWAITAGQDVAVKAAIRAIPEKDWREPVAGCGFEIAETVHAMNETEKAFRLIIKREKRNQGELFDGVYFHHAVASNWAEEKSAYDVLVWHNQRGQAENFNKELKGGFGMERMPCGQTSANAVWFRIGVIAYNLFLGFKQWTCPESWGRHTIATFRWRLLKVAGRIVRHAGQSILKLAVDADRLALLQSIRQKIFKFTPAI